MRQRCCISIMTALCTDCVTCWYCLWNLNVQNSNPANGFCFSNYTQVRKKLLTGMYLFTNWTHENTRARTLARTRAHSVHIYTRTIFIKFILGTVHDKNRIIIVVNKIGKQAFFQLILKSIPRLRDYAKTVSWIYKYIALDWSVYRKLIFIHERKNIKYLLR